MNLSVTITRASLALPNLVITNYPTGDFWIPEDGLEEPEVNWRITYAPDHPDVHGRAKIGASLEASTIPLQVYTKAATAAALAANKATLRAALGQFAFNVTVNIDGATATYSADPCGPKWGQIDSGMLRAYLARASVVIPVYPIAS